MHGKKALIETGASEQSVLFKPDFDRLYHLIQYIKKRILSAHYSFYSLIKKQIPKIDKKYEINFCIRRKQKHGTHLEIIKYMLLSNFRCIFSASHFCGRKWK